MKIRRGQLKPVFGSTQEERFPHALDPEYALIDERTLADKIAFALEFAPLLQFYNESNKPDGDWSAFFEGDRVFLLANIVTSNFGREQFQSWALYNSVRQGEERTGEILDEISRLIRRIDHWWQWSQAIATKNSITKGNFSEDQIEETLRTIINDDLKPHFGKDFTEALNSLPPTPGGESWPSYWQRRQLRLSEEWNKPPEDQGAVSAAGNTPTDQMFSILNALHGANFRLRQVAAQYLVQSLDNDSSHAPHTALYIAFARLLDLFRGKINTVTGRHLDFYYRTVLKLEERGSSPDVAHVCFTAAPQVPRIMLPAGTLLNAGKDAGGNVREYATDADLFINHARVAAMRAVYLARDRFAASRHARDRVVGILALPRADSQDGFGQPLSDPSAGWPSFGINETAAPCPDTLNLQAELGFIVASPALLLQEGERNVTISITFTGENSLEHALREYQNAARRLLDGPVSSDVLLSDAFKLSLSTEKGWLEIPNASFRRHPVVGIAMEIEFTLDPLLVPVVANPALSPESWQGQWPMLKLVLNPFARVFAYPFFKDLAIDNIEFRVAVSGLAKIQVRNEFGPLNATQPFPFFGPIPALGSYLLLSHPEFAVKRIDHVAVTIDWFNLPVPPESFASYYAAYNLGTTDDSFQIRWSVFGSGKWFAPSAGSDLFPMFARDYEGSAGVLSATALGLEIPEIPLPASADPAQSQPATDVQPSRGTIRFELAQPAYGFGHAAFPRTMAELATANARLGRHGSPKPLPNPPFTPIARSVSLDYESSDTLALRRALPENQAERFYSLSPFGYAKHQGRAPKMFPTFEEQGHLYLGVADITPLQTLTLLFQIRDAGFSPVPAIRRHHDEVEEPLSWRYLSNNEWKDFPRLSLISDSTIGLTRSGIVKLALPDDITIQNTVMQGDRYWIEAALPRVADVYWCNLVSINTQAVTATRVYDPKSDLVPAVSPAFSITQLSEKQPQIKTVSQPFPTSGGRARETPVQFRTRVSERLRHKDRAIQTFDYERLILDEFPEVGQVKCIGHNNSKYFPAAPAVDPGMLFIVAAPRLEDPTVQQPRLPQSTLNEIREFIHPRTSPFAKDIHVINPVYEPLKIFVQVEFTPDGDVSCYFDDLNRAMSQYLQPWFQEPAKAQPPKALYIGSGQVQGYELASFIQQQSYVRRLHSLKMLHTYQTESGYVSDWYSIERRVWASAPWAVLIPAAQHSIAEVKPNLGKIFEGIGNLSVGENFVVSPPTPEDNKSTAPQPRYFLVVPHSAITGAAGHDPRREK